MHSELWGEGGDITDEIFIYLSESWCEERAGFIVVC
jgi:hypothetical protein